MSRSNINLYIVRSHTHTKFIVFDFFYTSYFHLSLPPKFKNFPFRFRSVQKVNEQYFSQSFFCEEYYSFVFKIIVT
ncbi:hypothetical protein FND36_05145 [Lachnospiraceae bacterium KGMB03038]|nr:hypothetical protein FND36_05145 [Lachnospiraceae bacterium KGMB03038]